MIPQDDEHFVRPVLRSLGRTVQRLAKRLGIARRPLRKTHDLRVRQNPFGCAFLPSRRVFAPLSQSLRAPFLSLRQRTAQRTLSRRLDSSRAYPSFPRQNVPISVVFPGLEHRLALRKTRVPHPEKPLQDEKANDVLPVQSRPIGISLAQKCDVVVPRIRPSGLFVFLLQLYMHQIH